MELKEGDIIVAINPCTMQGSNINALVVGNEYAINHVFEDAFAISSEFDKLHHFYLKEFDNYFKRKEDVDNPPIMIEDVNMFLLKQEHARNPLKRLKEIQYLILRAYENGQKVELSLIAELLNIVK